MNGWTNGLTNADNRPTKVVIYLIHEILHAILDLLAHPRRLKQERMRGLLLILAARRRWGCHNPVRARRTARERACRGEIMPAPIWIHALERDLLHLAHRPTFVEHNPALIDFADNERGGADAGVGVREDDLGSIRHGRRPSFPRAPVS
jgi:hypothetical protein